MEKLDEIDLRKLLAAAEILARDVDYARFPNRAVDAICAVIEVDFVSYNEVDTQTGATRFLLKPDLADFTPGASEYAAYVRRYGNHPVIAQKIAAASRDDPRHEAFLGRLRFLGVVGNCCGQGELRLNLGLTVASAPTRRIGIAVNRSLRDFNVRDAARLEALRPYIQAAYRNAVHAERTTSGEAPPPQPVFAPAADLTPRESEVLYWVSMGKTNEEVAEIVGAKPMTVKKHLEHIYDKLGVPNRTAAARLAAANRLRA